MILLTMISLKYSGGEEKFAKAACLSASVNFIHECVQYHMLDINICPFILLIVKTETSGFSNPTEIVFCAFMWSMACQGSIDVQNAQVKNPSRLKQTHKQTTITQATLVNVRFGSILAFERSNIKLGDVLIKTQSLILTGEH